MAIEAYVGLPGHGKSYGVVEHVVIPSLAEGRHVVTNIPLEREDLITDFGAPGAEITQLPEDWYERPDMAGFVPAGCVLVLDELWRRWPSGLKANNALLADKALLAEHRHMVDAKGRSMRVVLVTQDLSQVASWVRILVEQTYRMTKLTAIGANKRFRVDIFAGGPTGSSPPKSKLIRQLYGRYRPEVYRYYQSATQSQTGSVGDESKADKRGVIWRSPAIIFSIIAPLVGIPLLLWHLISYFGSGFGMIPPAEEVEPGASAALVNPLPPALQAAPVVESPLPSAAAPVEAVPVVTDSIIWRVAGSIRRSAEDVPATAQPWASRIGYGLPEPDAPVRGSMVDMVVLASSLYGLRYVPVADCSLTADGINYQCQVDGTRATPWTGRGDATHWAGDSKRLVSRTASVVGDATGTSGPASSVVNPLPESIR